MTPRERRIREQAHRHRLILTGAREMAETEGWDAVTTRRLADHIEYSQPVLYQHFKNKDAIVHAVALEGFGELAEQLRAARLAATAPGEALTAVGAAYAAFAAAGPALYQAMLTLDAGDPDADPAEPAPFAGVLAEIRAAVEPVAGGRDPQSLAEAVWAGWHGLAVLTASGRLPAAPDRAAALTALLLDAAPAA